MHVQEVKRLLYMYMLVIVIAQITTFKRLGIWQSLEYHKTIKSRKTFPWNAQYQPWHLSYCACLNSTYVAEGPESEGWGQCKQISLTQQMTKVVTHQTTTEGGWGQSSSSLACTGYMHSKVLVFSVILGNRSLEEGPQGTLLCNHY